MRGAPAILAGVAALALAACTSGPYKKAIEDFAAATATADRAIGEMAVQLEGRERQRRIEAATADAATALTVRAISEESCRSEDSACALASNGEPIEPGPQLVNSRALVREILRYSQLLGEIANADQEAEVEGAIASANASIAKIAAAFKRPVPAAVSPAGELVNWLVGQYMDYLKLQALRDATTAAEQAFPETEAFLVALSAALDEPTDVDHTLAFNDARTRFRNDPSAANLAQWNLAAAQLDLALRLDADDVFIKMRESHRALAQALAQPDLDFESAIRLIREYQDSAEELLDILDRLKTAVAEG
jgi:hypothetical protein